MDANRSPYPIFTNGASNLHTFLKKKKSHNFKEILILKKWILYKSEQLHEQFVLTAAVKPEGTQAYIKIIFKILTTRE